MPVAQIVVIALIVGAGALAGVVFAVRHRPGPDRAVPLTDEAVLREIERLLGAGRRIDAIRLMRQATGLGLRDAKDAVEAIEVAARGGPVKQPRSAEPEPDYVAEARRLKRSGQKILAVKLVRERTGLGLVEAVRIVDAL
jgi:ribosomal protein L7/L12